MTIKRKKLFWKLYPSFLTISFISLLAIVMIALWSFKSFYYQERAVDLEIRAKILRPVFSRLIQSKDYQEIQQQTKKLGDDSLTRITIILPSGKVIGDNKKDPSTMDNHKNRPEVEQAILYGKGLSTRYGQTLAIDSMYFAMPIIADAESKTIGIIRTSMPLNTLRNALWSIYYKVSLGFFILIIITAFASWWMSKILVRPLEVIKVQAQRLAKGDFSSRVQLRSNDSLESEQLGQAFNEIAIQLNQRIEIILNQRNEQEAVFSSMVEGVIAVDSNENVLRINQAAYNMLKISEKDIEGVKFQNVIENVELHNLILFALQQDKPIGQEIIIHNDVEQVLLAQSAPLLDIHKNKCGTLVVFNDITKLKEFELQRKEFVANVSHELRTPLTAIQGLSETLIEFPDLPSEKRDNFTHVIHTHSIRLESIIENLLTLSKIEKETEIDEIEFTYESITLALSNAIFLCKDKALERNIDIILNNTEEIIFKHNSSLIEQAIINLLNNAIKYSNGNSKIKITAIKQHNDIKISVEDQGSGIPNEHLPRLFERFYRVDKARSRALGGTGLGLSIVKHIVLAHKGTVNVQSEINKGSIFTLVLPLGN